MNATSIEAALRKVCRMCENAEEGSEGFEVNFGGNCDACFIGQALRNETTEKEERQ